MAKGPTGAPQQPVMPGAMPPGGTLRASAFSAARFYAAVARGRPSQEGLVHGELTLPPGGLCVPAKGQAGSSLLWIDGAARQASAVRALLDSVRAGEVPAPLRPDYPAPSQSSPLSFSAPDYLKVSGLSVAASLGVVEPLLTTFKSARWRRCRMCGGRSPVARAPSAILGHLLEELAPANVTVSLSSEDPQFSAWCSRMGFREEAGPQGDTQARIDTVEASPAALSRLVPVLSAAWRLRGLTIHARSDAGLRSISPNGSCTSCGSPCAPISARRLRDIFERGACKGVAEPPELGLMAEGLSLEELLLRPMREWISRGVFRLEIPEPLQRAIRSVKLEHLCLGDSAAGLCPAELALLSILRSLFPPGPPALPILDVPHGLLAGGQAEGLAALLLERAESSPVICVARHPCSPAHALDAHALPLTSGELIAKLSVFGRSIPPIDVRCGVQELASDTAMPIPSLSNDARLEPGSAMFLGPLALAAMCKISVRTLPVFENLSLKRRTVVEELGLYEPLAKLACSSVDARALGLEPRDLRLRSAGKSRWVCPGCGGLGVQLLPAACFSRPEAVPCPSCDGARFAPPIQSALFRGASLPQMLNSTIAELHDTLCILPKSALPLRLVDVLGLSHLTLGAPVALLSFSERRRFQALLAALNHAHSKEPAVVVFERPFAGLCEVAAAGLETLLKTASMAPHVAWAITH